MGQLERYGLYVLCVVIVLILGVAIWGGDPALAGGADQELDRVLEANAAPSVAPPGSTAADGDAGTPGFFDQLKPVAPPPSADVSAEDELAGVVFADAPAGEPKAGAAAGADAEATAATHALRTYRVQPNDTMEGIARQVLGDRRRVKAIRDLNPDVDPKRMRPGTELKLPAPGGAEQPTAKAPPADGWREYRVVKGDSASEISVKMYGTTRHARKILEANGISDPTKMRLNAVLRIPPIE